MQGVNGATYAHLSTQGAPLLRPKGSHSLWEGANNTETHAWPLWRNSFLMAS